MTEPFYNVAILVIGALGAVFAVAGDTWDPTKPRFLQRFTARGWMAVVCIVITLLFSVLKERLSHKNAIASTQELEKRQNMLMHLQEELTEANRNVARLTATSNAKREVFQPGKIHEISVSLSTESPQRLVRFYGCNCGLLVSLFPLVAPEFSQQHLRGKQTLPDPNQVRKHTFKAEQEPKSLTLSINNPSVQEAIERYAGVWPFRQVIPELAGRQVGVKEFQYFEIVLQVSALTTCTGSYTVGDADEAHQWI